MAKTTNLFVRLEPGLKEQAECILEQLGIPVSNAVNIFLKQVVMQRGINRIIEHAKSNGN